MNSPLRGIERISEELKAERHKANIALQDRARLKIETESLKQLCDQKDTEIEELKSNLDNSNERLIDYQKYIEELQMERSSLLESIKIKDENVNRLCDDCTTLRNKLESSSNSVNSRDSQIAVLTVKLESLEGRAYSKDDLASKLKAEIAELRKDQIATEQERLDAHQLFTEQKKLAEELAAKLQLITTVENSYNTAKDSNENLRNELEKILESNAYLITHNRELTRQDSDRLFQLKQLEETISTLIDEKNQLQKDIKDLEDDRDLVTARMRAEIDAGDAARERADASARGREFLEQQIEELRESHKNSLNYGSELEAQLTSVKTFAAELQTQLSAAKETMLHSESAMNQAASMEEMVLEIDVLRTQLNEVRKQLMKRDMEDEAGVMAPQAVIDREQKGRQLYESIIQDMSLELDKMNNKYHETNRRCEEAMRKAARIEQLEEEVALYKEMAKNISEESQSAALTISEAMERNIKLSHEKQQTVHELQRTSSELRNAEAEITRNKEELTTLRGKVKLLHSGKLAAEQKAAENMTVCCKLETSMEELKQQYNKSVIESEKIQRTVHEQSFQLSDLRIKLSELDKVKNDYAVISTRLVSTKTETTVREKELVVQLESLKHHKLTLQRELDAMKDKAGLHRQGAVQSQSETNRLRSELESISAERDRYQLELVQYQSSNAEKQLLDLKRDLEETVTQWKGMEEEKAVKDKVILQYQNECNKEKEKCALMKMQVALLEEKLRVALQELSVYRGIDVYHNSMQKELQSYRNDKAANESLLERSLNSKLQQRVNEDGSNYDSNSVLGGTTNAYYYNNKNSSSSNSQLNSSHRSERRANQHSSSEDDNNSNNRIRSSNNLHSANRNSLHKVFPGAAKTNNSAAINNINAIRYYQNRDIGKHSNDDDGDEVVYSSTRLDSRNSSFDGEQAAALSSTKGKFSLSDMETPSYHHQETDKNNHYHDDDDDNVASVISDRESQQQLQQQQVRGDRHYTLKSEHNSSNNDTSNNHHHRHHHLYRKDNFPKAHIHNSNTMNAGKNSLGNENADDSIAAAVREGEEEEEEVEYKGTSALPDAVADGRYTPIHFTTVATTTTTPAMRRDNNNDDMATTSVSNDSSSSSHVVVSEIERLELLRQRSERKAVRDRQLRDKIMREGLSLSASSLPSNSRITVDNSTVTTSIANSSKSGNNSTSVANIRSTSSNNNNNNGSSSNKTSIASRSPATTTPRYADPPYASYAAPKRPISPVKDTPPQVYRPAKTDYDRARKLLSM